MGQLDNANGLTTDIVPSPAPRHEFSSIYLDERDPFERAIADIVYKIRRERADYNLDGDMFSSFNRSAQRMNIAGFGIPEAILHLMAIEQEKLTALRGNGRTYETDNDTVDKTYLNLAGYACILYAWIKQQADKANGL